MTEETKFRAAKNYSSKNREKNNLKTKEYRRKKRLDPEYRKMDNTRRQLSRVPEVPFSFDITEEEAMRMEQIWKVTCPLHYESCRIERLDGTEQTGYSEEGRQYSTRMANNHR